MKQTKVTRKAGTRGTSPKSTKGSKANQIKLSVDVHAASFMCCRQIDRAAPQPPQRMKPEAFLGWLVKQQAMAREVIVCYEAGPTGFWLAREVKQLGARCVVVRPSRLDAYGKRVKNDRTDALALAEQLDRYLAGNPRALAEVRVPTRAEETLRAESRQREQFHKTRQSMAAMGRGQMLLWGHRVKGQWWGPRKWKQLEQSLPGELVQLLEPLRETLLFLSQKLAQIDKELTQAGAGKPRPLGAGARTLEIIDREICDWQRFNNRKEVGSYAGLCGGVRASGESHAELPITKAGNRRLRCQLVEMSWRMVYWQKQSPLIQRWKGVLLNPRATSRERKKAIVAVARKLLVDLWRWRTGKMSLEEHGWIVKED